MKLNIIIPTYNRAASLRKTLTSLTEADLPQGLEVQITVVNNNSTDSTEEVFDEIRTQFADKRIDYLFEDKQGRSFALNAGIRKADGDLVTAIDDDIQVQKNWLVEIEKIFRTRRNEIEFAGGKVLPNLEQTEVPVWIAPLKDGVLGWRDYGDSEWVYGEKTPMLTGGHAIIKREVFDEIGLFTEGVGVAGKDLMSCEDNIFYDKLLSAGKRGIYFPQLVVFHFVPKYRVSKSYYRQWCFGAGMSWNLMEVHYKPFNGPRILGIPRYLYKQVAQDLFGKIKAMAVRNQSESLARENILFVFAGYFYARNLKATVAERPLRSIARRVVKTAER